MKYFKDLQSIKNQMNELVCVYDDLQDRLYEIDRSWQNNLVFHGIKPDAGGVYESTDCLEAKIKGVLRTNLNIGREIPIGMVKYQKQAARFWSLLVFFSSTCPMLVTLLLVNYVVQILYARQLTATLNQNKQKPGNLAAKK